MNILSNFFWTVLTRKFILILLLTVFLSGGSVFAQDSGSSIGLKTDPEYLVLITTLVLPLKVRQQPTVSSPVVGHAAKGSKIPFVKSENAANGKGLWFQVEYAQGKFGWVSGNYSKKIRTTKKPVTSEIAQQDVNTQTPVEDEKPVLKTKAKNSGNSVQSSGIIKEPTQQNKVKTEKSWANIEGFRSAKFGMRLQEVRTAIYQDFSLRGKKKVSIINHPTQQTKSLAITVKNLLPNSGDSRVVYVFGYKSKKLTHINIVNGYPADKNVTAQQVVNSGNFLGNHFLKKRYQKDGFVAHAKLNDGSVLIFRGKDQKGRMVLLRLSNTQPNKNNKDIKATLNLSYIEKPGHPDAFQLKEGDF